MTKVIIIKNGEIQVKLRVHKQAKPYQKDQNIRNPNNIITIHKKPSKINYQAFFY